MMLGKGIGHGEGAGMIHIRGNNRHTAPAALGVLEFEFAFEGDFRAGF